MIEPSNISLPAWSKPGGSTEITPYTGWLKTEEGAQGLAWSSEGLSVPQPAPEEPEEPEIKECPICEETRQTASAEIEEAVEPLKRRLEEVTADFKGAVAGLSRVIDRDIIRLAKLLAERVIRQTVEMDPTLVEKNLARALEAAGPLLSVILKTHPDDLDRLRSTAPAMAEELAGGPVNLSVQASDEVGRGGVIVVYEEGLIDARFAQQLDSVTQIVEDLVAQGHGRRDELDSQEDND